jgi:hypothetical protein
VHLNYLWNLSNLSILAGGILSAAVFGIWKTKFINPEIRGAAVTGTARVLSMNRATARTKRKMLSHSGSD